MKTMYERIKELRQMNHMSQEDLARAVGYKNRSMIARIESGEVDLSQSKIVAFAQALGVTTDYLMDGEDRDAVLEEISQEQQVLFRLARSAKPEAIRAAVAVLKSMQDTNNDF